MGQNLRVVTLNFWGTEPPLERRVALAVKQLRALAPDVVCLQEVQPLDHGTTADALAAPLGMHAHYAKACEWADGAWGPGSKAGEQGLAILSRAPLLDNRVLALPDPRDGDIRILLSGQVATSGGPIWVHTTHLHYKLDDGVARERQVCAIDAAIRAERTNDSAPQILCGDFNATPDSDEIRFLRGLTTLEGRRTHFQDAWLRLHREPGPGDGPAEGITWSSENRHTRPLRSLDLDRRIDYVLVTSRKKDGRGTVADCRVVMTEREGTDEICASDHYGVVADIQIVATT
ncbi:MAG: Endonuclease/exonuclease/phosphatase [Myxococcales bacterium]|nr:Endonuclease/exonuclease/phosphatase [Myxococcales bacterium]